MKIRAILSEETLPVRQLILRPGKSLGACIFEGDDHSSSIHLGAFEKENLLGVVSLMKNKIDHFEDKSLFQLRGMANCEKITWKFFGAMPGRSQWVFIKNTVSTFWANHLKFRKLEFII